MCRRTSIKRLQYPTNVRRICRCRDYDQHKRRQSQDHLCHAFEPGRASRNYGIGDIIKAIDGQTLDGLTSSEITSRIRGSEGSPVTLTIERDGKELTFTMNRTQISRPNFQDYTVEQGIEYMRLALFSDTDTVNRFNQAYSELAEKGH